MRKKTLFVVSISLGALLAQNPPQAPPSFKGVVRKNRAPVSNDVLRVKFPKPVESRLHNGMSLLALEDHRSPTVQLEIAMPASTLNDPRDLAGIGDATASLLRLGTKTRTSVQIADTLQELGASLNASAGDRYAYFRVSTLSENLDAVLALLADVMFNPSFPQDELDKWKNRQLSSLQQIRTQPGFLGQERFFAVLYPHDNRSIVAPTPESINRITRDRIVEYYSQNFRPEGGRVAVAGDIAPKAIADKLDAILGNWKGAAPKPPELALPGAIGDKKIYLIHRPNSVQTNLYIGNLALGRLDPDYIPAMVMNQVLGSGPASRLFRNIREDKGYTYGISSGFGATHYINYFVVSTSVRTDVTGPAMEEIFKELVDIRDRPVPSDELDGAKRALVANFALSTESPATALRNATMIKEYGFPPDYWDVYPEAIAKVTAADVQRLARKYIPVDNSQIVAIGDASKIRDVLAKFGPVEEWDAEGHLVK
ncbi:MAG: insulinase family protein [Acidobacteriia bacterium]|nr:insulinase family protein [Terriglobia bacterium]